MTQWGGLEDKDVPWVGWRMKVPEEMLVPGAVKSIMGDGGKGGAVGDEGKHFDFVQQCLNSSFLIVAAT